MSLDLLVQGLFDYAGMFPPAALSFDDALAQTARSHALRRPGILGNDIVLKYDQLSRLDPEALRKAGYMRRDCHVCIVGVTEAQLPDVVPALVAWNEAAFVDPQSPPPPVGGPVRRRITALECVAVGFDQGIFQDAARQLTKAGISLYVEPSWKNDEWASNAASIWSLLDKLTEDRVGLKVRCAGPTAVSPDTMAGLVIRLNAEGIPFKATQGLHHPIVEARYDNQMGFLSLAIALRLQGILGWSKEQVLECLNETDPAAFSTGKLAAITGRAAGGVGWRTSIASHQRVRTAMQRVPFAIGSCSLQEPDDDLARLFPATKINLLE